jgi:hypothetical protein
MWNYLGDSLMRKLKSKMEEEEQGHTNIYAHIIKEAEHDLMEDRISGHEAAKKILSSIFTMNGNGGINSK